jgi:hypothetical protein
MPLPPELADTYRTYWAFAQQAAMTRNPDGSYAYTVTDLIAAAADAAQATGQPFTFTTGSQLSQLFGIARTASRASDELQGASPGSPITSSMWTNWPTAAPIGVQDVQPEFMARAQFSYTNALGEQSTGWVTLTGLTQLPPSQANLYNRLQGAAMTSYSVAPDEGGSPTSDAEVMQEFGEFTDVQLFAV